MPLFHYKGIDASGKIVSGEIEALERRAAGQRLLAQGIRPVSLQSGDGSPAPRPVVGLTATPNVEDIQEEDFFRERKKTFRLLPARKPRGDALALSFQQKLLMLLSAGYPIGDALKLLATRLTDPVLKDLCATFWKKLSEGSTLAKAFASTPQLFSDSTVHLIEAGEATGNLAPILERNVTHLTEMQELRNKVVGGLIYPLFVCALAGLVIFAFGKFMLPQIQKMIVSMGGRLNLFIELFMNGLDTTLRVSPFIFLGGLLCFFMLLTWRKTEAGRSFLDYWTLRLPLYGQIFLFHNIFQTSSLMATLLSSGINTTETLRLVERTINNVHLRAKFSAARKQIQEGVSMATAIKRVRYMPDIAMDILTVGENTGSIVNSLREINKIYRKELTDKLNFLTTAITIGAFIVAFGFVVIIALIIVTSLLDVSRNLRS